MKKTNNFAELFDEFKRSDSYWAQKTIVDFSVELHKLMKLRKLSKKDFAEKIGKSRAYVTKVFKGEANFTIETMVRLVRALNGQMKIHVCPAEEKNVQWHRVLRNHVAPPRNIPKAWTLNMEVETLSSLDSVGGELG
jgi:transcriptional regulator with XRE-family HTH domain